MNPLPMNWGCGNGALPERLTRAGAGEIVRGGVTTHAVIP